jgi:transportin-3
LIVEASSEALILTDAILSCVTFPSEDWEIADSTVQFWSTFATYILSLGGNRQNDRTRVKDTFLPVFSALVDALVLRAQVTSWKLSYVLCLFQFYISRSYHISWRTRNKRKQISIYFFS